jgi:UDP-2,3-diacylglucosamine hydrolase
MGMGVKRLREGAFFIADSHYPHFGDELVEILKAIHSGNLDSQQLILMGDIFDLLFGCGRYIETFSKEAIELINLLSKEIEVIYLEGNHDFYLEKIFDDVQIYSRERQPVRFELNGKDVMLSHGDRFEMGLGYEIYTFLIRHPTVLRGLKVIERLIVDKNIQRLRCKNICREFSKFDERVREIVKHYPKESSMIIEGHYHQGIKLEKYKYISLPSLVCQKAVATVRGGEIVFVEIDEVLNA